MKKELLVEYGRKGEVLTFLAMLLDREKGDDAGINYEYDLVEDREGKIERRINTESLLKKESILRRLKGM